MEKNELMEVCNKLQGFFVLDKIPHYIFLHLIVDSLIHRQQYCLVIDTLNHAIHSFVFLLKKK